MQHRAKMIASTVLMAALLLGRTASADPAATPEAYAYLEKYGAQFPFDQEQQIIALYTRILGASAPENGGITVARDLEYGPDARHRVDVHYPKSGKDAAVLIYVPGGGFVAGDKNISPAIYDNIGHYFARKGVIAIIVRYRLAPAHQWPAGTEDVAAVVKWAAANVGHYGGDPQRLFIAGHSAGAAHVAGYAFAPKPASDDGVKGVILLSGVYSANGMFSAYYGTDKSRWSIAAPMGRVSSSRSLPTMLALGEYDPIPVQMESAQLFQRLCERDKRCPVIKQAVGHNHMSLVFHIDTADDSLAGDIFSFIQRNSKH